MAAREGSPGPSVLRHPRTDTGSIAAGVAQRRVKYIVWLPFSQFIGRLQPENLPVSHR